jgi:hypothetical protein
MRGRTGSGNHETPSPASGGNRFINRLSEPARKRRSHAKTQRIFLESSSVNSGRCFQPPVSTASWSPLRLPLRLCVRFFCLSERGCFSQVHNLRSTQRSRRLVVRKSRKKGSKPGQRTTDDTDGTDKEVPRHESTIEPQRQHPALSIRVIGGICGSYSFGFDDTQVGRVGSTCSLKPQDSSLEIEKVLTIG